MKMKSFLLVSAATVLLSGCVTPEGKPLLEAQKPVGIDVNKGYAAGRIETPEVETPSLDQLQNLESQATEMATEEDKLRRPAQKEAALALGLKGGLAWETKRINELLKQRSSELSQVYDFNRLLIIGPNNVTVLPPVISEAKENWELQDKGKVLRTAENVYEIISESVFTPNAPMWQTYLFRGYTTPDMPDNSLLPKTEAERVLWKKWTTEGWMNGIKQAHMIFESDMRKLERDYVGMIRYRKLLAQNMVTEPVVAEGTLGVTSSEDGKRMRVDDRAVRITRDSLLNPNAKEWDSRQ